jgi:hypothetical protein
MESKSLKYFESRLLFPSRGALTDPELLQFHQSVETVRFKLHGNDLHAFQGLSVDDDFAFLPAIRSE